jgi:pimeloyl-ACP methyl ester carboxylesterase
MTKRAVLGLIAILAGRQLVSGAPPVAHEKIAYGFNSKAGHYLQVGDARIYYEIYGKGRPIVMLHGGVFGYIDEFSGLIPVLSRDHMVIAIGLRGHGKSELGLQPLSFQQMANDAIAVIHQVTKEPVDLLGFSAGAMVAYHVAVQQPRLLRSLIAMGGPVDESGFVQEIPKDQDISNAAAEFAKQFPEFVAARRKIYPHPEDWDRLVRAFAELQKQPYHFTKDQIGAIPVPTLILAGDRDYFTKTSHFVDIYHMLQKGELAIVPGCGHVVFQCNPRQTMQILEDFLDR